LKTSRRAPIRNKVTLRASRMTRHVCRVRSALTFITVPNYNATKVHKVRDGIAPSIPDLGARLSVVVVFMPQWKAVSTNGTGTYLLYPRTGLNAVAARRKVSTPMLEI